MLGCRLPASKAGTRGSVIVRLELDRPLTFYPIMQNEPVLFLALLLVPALAYRVCAQSTGAAGLKSGRAIFEAGCAGCHGGNGKGAPETTTAFDRPAYLPRLH